MRYNQPDIKTTAETPAPVSAELLCALFDSMNKGMVIVEDGQIIKANILFYEIFALDANESASFDQIKSCFLQHTYAHPLDELFTNSDVLDFEFQSSLDLKWYAFRQYDHPHVHNYKLFVCTDISTYRRRDELLSFASKMEALGQLAGGVAHDFNNILSIVEGYARLLARHNDEGTEVHTYSQRIVQAARRGAGLTRQLLTFGTHKVISEGAVCLNDFLAEQEVLIRPLLDSSVNLILDVPKDKIILAIHTEQLSQILINTITNARDALEGQKGDIRITIKKAKNHALLTVNDNGCGMDEETLSKAINPFFTTKPSGKGTGLGLSQIYGLMQQIGGQMTITSKPRCGTDIVLQLPYGDLSNLTSENEACGEPDLQGQTVLIADDEPDVVEVMRQMLEEYGFNVLCAANGNDALAIQDSYPHKIDWLLSDVVMPDMSGPKLGSLMEAVRPDTRIIYMSGYPATGQMARITLPSEALFLAKPIDPQNLIKIMGSIDDLDGHRIDLEGLARLAGAWGKNDKE